MLARLFMASSSWPGWTCTRAVSRYNSRGEGNTFSKVARDQEEKAASLRQRFLRTEHFLSSFLAYQSS